MLPVGDLWPIGRVRLPVRVTQVWMLISRIMERETGFEPATLSLEG